MQKGHKRRFGLQIQISLHLVSSELQIDYHVRNKGLQLFCDLKAWIWKIRVSGLISDGWMIAFFQKLKAKQKTSTKYHILFVSGFFCFWQKLWQTGLRNFLDSRVFILRQICCLLPHNPLTTYRTRSLYITLKQFFFSLQDPMSSPFIYKGSWTKPI